MKRRRSLILIAISCFLFGSASILPIFSVKPAAGEWTAIAQILSPSDMKAVNFSLIDGVRTLWSEEEKILASIIAIFSLMLPIIKLSVLWAETLFHGLLSEKWMGFLQIISRYAMLEVFLVAMTVLLLKEMPGGSRITLEVGFYAFGGSVILSLLTAQWIEGDKKKLPHHKEFNFLIISPTFGTQPPQVPPPVFCKAAHNFTDSGILGSSLRFGFIGRFWKASTSPI